MNPPSPEALIKDVQAVRAAGYACAFEETLPGVSTMSVPVFGAAGELTAILSLTAPSTRLTPERVADLLPEALRRAAAISGLGYLPDASCLVAQPCPLVH